MRKVTIINCEFKISYVWKKSYLKEMDFEVILLSFVKCKNMWLKVSNFMISWNHLVFVCPLKVSFYCSFQLYFGLFSYLFRFYTYGKQNYVSLLVIYLFLFKGYQVTSVSIQVKFFYLYFMSELTFIKHFVYFTLLTTSVWLTSA